MNYMQDWRTANKEKAKEYAKTFKEKHGRKQLTMEQKEKQKEYMRKYNKVNRVELRSKKKIQIAKYPSYAASIKAKNKIWRETNKGYMNEYNKKRKSIDVSYKLRMYLRSRINKAIRGLVKQGSAVKDLGCSIENFKSYIENKFVKGMCWTNYGEWELDHIIPLAKFDLTNKEEFDKACHYTNYQPLWKVDNRSKRDK